MLTGKDNLLRAVHHAAPDHVPYAGEGAYRLVDHAGRKPPRTGRDAWGVTWAPLPESYLVGPGEPAESYPAAHPAATARALLSQPLPTAEPAAAFGDLLAGLDRAQLLVIGQHGAGPLDRLSQLLGPMPALSALAGEREAVAVILERIAAYHVAVAQAYIAAGVEAGWLADDYAGHSGPYLSLALWRRLLLPGLQRIVAVYRTAGLPVFFHTCGHSEVFIPDLIDIGVRAFNLQTESCDLDALRARFGAQICFVGGIPSQLMLEGTPAAVFAAARDAIERWGQGGGLILTPDQPLVYRSENERALVAAAQAYGRLT